VVFYVCDELGFVHHSAIPVGVDKFVGEQFGQSLAVAMDLGLIPGVLESDQLASIGDGRVLRKGLSQGQKEQQTHGEELHTSPSLGKQPGHKQITPAAIVRKWLRSSSSAGAASFSVLR
jgi:hypothetical protein